MSAGAWRGTRRRRHRGGGTRGRRRRQAAASRGTATSQGQRPKFAVKPGRTTKLACHDGREQDDGDRPERQDGPPGPRLHVALGLHRQVGRPVQRQRREAQDAAEQGERVQQQRERPLERPLRVEGHAAEHVAHGCAEQHREEHARAEERHVPRVAPQVVVHLVAELDRHAAQDEQPEHEHQRKVETTEGRGVEVREGGHHRPARREQPHFVPVPHRPNGVDGGVSPFPAADVHVQRPDAEVEAVQHRVASEHEGEDDEPGGGQHREQIRRH